MFILLSIILFAQIGKTQPAANPMFSVTWDDNSCLHEVHDIGVVIGTGAHTIHTKLTLPEYTGPRQWILNLGQESSGANHWIWGGSAIQFGTWSGYQIQDVDITSCADLTTTFDGDHTLKLYCDGELVGQEENANINIRNSILAIGGIQGSETPDGDFKGCVEEVKLWTSELSASQVQSLTTEGCVSLYEDGSFGGNSVTLGIGEYSHTSLINLGNDAVSSIKVDEGCQATIFEHGFDGREATLLPGNYDISEIESYIGNDQLSSIRITSYDAVAFWGSCHWITSQKSQDEKLGFSCPQDEIMTGFRLQQFEEHSVAHNDPISARCCKLGGHTQVAECDRPKTAGLEVAECDADDHKVFTAVFQKPKSGQHYLQTDENTCCKVECHEEYCANKDWGVNQEKCWIKEAPKDNTANGRFDLLCPTNTLMTKVIDGEPLADIGGIQLVHKIECCELDQIAQPTQSPTMNPTNLPSRIPSSNPTSHPTFNPTQQPTINPTLAPTTQTDCLLAIDRCQVSDAEYLASVELCLPECYDFTLDAGLIHGLYFSPECSLQDRFGNMHGVEQGSLGCKNGEGVVLDGEGYIDLTPVEFGGPFSLALWHTRSFESGHYQRLLTLANVNGEAFNNWHFDHLVGESYLLVRSYTSDNPLDIHGDLLNTVRVYDLDIPADQWGLLVITSENGVWNVYFDGKLMRTLERPEMPKLTREFNRLGADVRGRNSWSGTLGSLQIWDRALSVKEIIQLQKLGRHHTFGQPSYNDPLNHRRNLAASPMNRLVQAEK